MYGTETQSNLSEPCNLGTFQNVVREIFRQRGYLVNPLIEKGYSSSSKHSNSISPHTKWGCAIHPNINPSSYTQPTVNNPQAGDALEYAPPLKKKGRIVFCACMYDTRKNKSVQLIPCTKKRWKILGGQEKRRRSLLSLSIHQAALSCENLVPRFCPTLSIGTGRREPWKRGCFLVTSQRDKENPSVLLPWFIK